MDIPPDEVCKKATTIWDLTRVSTHECIDCRGFKNPLLSPIWSVSMINLMDMAVSHQLRCIVCLLPWMDNQRVRQLKLMKYADQTDIWNIYRRYMLLE